MPASVATRFGFLEGLQLGDAVLLLEASAIHHGIWRFQPSGTIYIDFMAAFPNVFHRCTWQAMQDMGGPLTLIVARSALYACTHGRRIVLDALRRRGFASPLGSGKIAQLQGRCLP